MLTSISKQATNLANHKLYQVQLRYTTRTNNLSQTNFVTRKDLIRTDILLIESMMFDILQGVEDKGELHSWAISIVPQIAYKHLENKDITQIITINHR